MSIYDELKVIEKDQRSLEYSVGQICYSFYCHNVPANGNKYEKIKEILIRSKDIGKDDNVVLVKLEDPLSDFEPISEEWHISEPIKKRFLDIFKKVDAYYCITADGSYAASGYLWNTLRLLQKDEELVILEFFITD